MATDGAPTAGITRATTHETDSASPVSTASTSASSEVTLGAPLLAAWPVLERPSLPTQRAPITTLASFDRNWLRGAAGFERARRLGRELRVPVLVYVSTSWCPLCKKAEAQILPSEIVRPVLERVLKVKLDAEADPSCARIARSLAVASYPQLRWLAPFDDLVTPLSFGSYDDPSRFLHNLDTSLQRFTPSYLSAADRLVTEGRLDDAVSLLSRALSVLPEDGDLFFARARAKLANRDIDGAYSDLLKIIAASPTHGAARLEAALLDYAAGRDLQAQSQLDRVIAADPRFEEGLALYTRAAVRYQRRELEGALDDAAKACAIGRDDSCRLQTWLRDVAKSQGDRVD